MKREIRILGLDDSPFTKKDKKVLVIGTMYRGGNFLDGIISFQVERDGEDATQKIIDMIEKTRFKNIGVVLLNGISFGGFNIIDVEKISKFIPVIVVMRKIPNYEKFFNAMKKSGKGNIIRKIKRLMSPENINGIFVQYFGISKEKVEKILKITCTHSKIPEPLRIAHIIASGVKFGESRGNA